jgi:hypothetical protein
MTLITFGIVLESRHSKAIELAELLMFASDLAAEGLHGLVKSAHYDSNSCCCTFDLSESLRKGSAGEERIRQIAIETISQFEWSGFIEHGNTKKESEKGSRVLPFA